MEPFAAPRFLTAPDAWERIDPALVHRHCSAMNWLWLWLRKCHRATQSLREAEHYHTESRARMAQAAAAGRSGEALRESARQMGVSMSRTEGSRGRIVSIGGVRI